jgi:ubiquitin conjugation factor E4 B
VDPDYYRQTKRLTVADETKINAAKEEADEFYGQGMEVDTKPNFISDLFFLLNSTHHLGLAKTIGTRKEFEKGISELEEDLRNFEARRAEWGAVSCAHVLGLTPSRTPPLWPKARPASRASK